MSRKLINHNADLKRLEDDAFDIEIRDDVYLLVHGIPYVNAQKQIAYGTLVSKLELAGDKTISPVKDHVTHFIGDHPCDKDGSKIVAIQNASNIRDLGNGLIINHTFSGKLPNRQYRDYHEKITQYFKILSHEARAIDPGIKQKSPRIRESNEPNSVFHYPDTNSSRAEIGAVSSKLQNLKIAIVGLGGTGSYVLDFVAKTHVAEIHLFDGDLFLNHNAFRAPGAASHEELDKQRKKVAYLEAIYSRMRKFIFAHDYNITSETASDLSGMDFVFVCVDDPASKKVIIDGLIEKKIRFVDVGIGIQAINGALTGGCRVTTGSQEKYDHIERRVSFAEPGNNDYALNIQIAEINALNASLAVVKWKKLFGFYHDLQNEHHSSYSINVNKIVNDEIVS
jgi:hypothetical protein